MSQTLRREAATIYSRPPANSSPGTYAALMDSCRRIFATLSGWSLRSQRRQDLSQLNAHLLNDIGVSQEEATSGARKWFWM
jgi:uncharacterized protein YjiS (DUF1127 family)